MKFVLISLLLYNLLSNITSIPTHLSLIEQSKKNNFHIVFYDKTSLYETASWLSEPAQANLLHLANKMALARDTNLSTHIGNKELSPM